MTCVEAEKMVVPYMKDELSPTELEDFLNHIKTCDNCREELEIHYMVDVGLKKRNPTGPCAISPYSRSRPTRSRLWAEWR